MKLERYLRSCGLGQSEFARRAGISQSRVWDVLQGRGLSTWNALKVEAATEGEVTVADLLPEGRRGAA